jgi:hypothetical protein
MIKKREDIALALSILSTVAALAGVAIGLQARNDVVATARYNTAIVGCQGSAERYRRFFLKLVNSPEVPFESYFPGETTTFERTKIELIDSLNSLAYSSSQFEDIVRQYTDEISKFDASINSPFLGNADFEISKLGQYLRNNSELSKLSEMPGKLHEKCNVVLASIRS